MTKKHYEFVVALSSKMEQEAQNNLIETIESNFKDAILDRDVIGNLQTEYLFGGKKDNSTVFVISYYLELESDQVKKVKENLKYVEGILRSFFFSMSSKDKFFHFKDLNKKLVNIVEEFKNRVSDKK